MKNWRLWAYVILSVAFLALKLVEEPQPPRIADDSSGYAYLTWWGSLRPCTTPLFFELCGANTQIICWAQIALSLIVWLTLAYAVRTLFITAVGKLTALALVLFIAASRDVSLWDSYILSDSLSFSLFAAVSAAWIWAMRRWSILSMCAFSIALALWCFTRDFNALICGLIGGTILLQVVFRTAPLRAAGVVVIAIGLVIANQFDLKKGVRWHLPLFNVIGKKVLVQPEMKQYFVEHGMPLSPRIEAMRGKSGLEFEKIPELEAWAEKDGRQTLLSWLLTHPKAGLADIRATTHSTEAYVPKDYISLYGLPPFVLIFLVGCVSVGFSRRRDAMVLLLLLSAPFLYYLAVGADAMESTRHALQVTVEMALATGILLAGVVDRWVQGIPPAAAPSPTTPHIPPKNIAVPSRGSSGKRSRR